MSGDDLGTWQPWSLDEVVERFAAATFRWWISGGHALELHLGRSWRGHADVDVGVIRAEADAVFELVADWHPHVASSGRLTPWDGTPLDAAANHNNVWCRRSPDGPWELDVTVGDGSSSEWIYRRDPTLRRPWAAAVLHSNDDIPYLAPELQLLFKSKQIRPKDDVDAREVIPALDPDRRHRLGAWLPPGHPWRALTDR